MPVRIDDEIPAPPILLMTGYAENAANRQSFLGEGMDLIAKPFHIDELLEKIRRGLERRF
jgi:hypothetical protein